MNGANWYNQNSNRSYPFIQNKNDGKITNSEILDCRFYVTNPNTTNIKVFLQSKKNTETGIIYTFCCKLDEDLLSITFKKNKNDTWQCIWNTDNPDFYGFIIVGN